MNQFLLDFHMYCTSMFPSGMNLQIIQILTIMCNLHLESLSMYPKKFNAASFCELRINYLKTIMWYSNCSRYFIWTSKVLISVQLDWYARNNEADATTASEVERRACQLYPANAELAYVDWFMDDRSVIALSKEMKDLPDRNW